MPINMGLQSAYGLQGLQDAIRQRIKDQIEAEQRDREEQQRQFINARLTAEDARRAQEHGLTIQSLLDQRNEQKQATEQKLTEATAKQFAPGANIPLPPSSPIVSRLVSAGLARSNPAGLPSRETRGFATLPGPETPPIAGRLQMINRQAAPASTTMLGTDEQRKAAENEASLKALVENPSTPAALSQFLKLRTALPKGENIPYQLITEPNGPAGTISDANYMLNGKPIVAIRQKGRLTYQGQDVTDQVKPYVAPQQPGVQLVMGPSGPMLADKRSGVAKPITDASGQIVGRPTSATVENRLASARAVQQTGDDIIAQLRDPATVAALGPEMGRVSKFEDFLGNPPPQFSELAGSIESYALANMGVHGMRSVQGAEQIKKLLSGHHTPESLIAAVQGLQKFSQHFVENETRASGTQPTKKPTAAELIKKYGG